MSTSVTTGRLLGFGFSAGELVSLGRGGVVLGEKRGERVYYKLRFRHEGQQRVRYVGASAEVAAEVARELAALQTPRHEERQWRLLEQHARQVLQESRLVLLPLLARAGYRFHGFDVRRCRSKAATCTTTDHLSSAQQPQPVEDERFLLAMAAAAEDQLDRTVESFLSIAPDDVLPQDQQRALELYESGCTSPMSLTSTLLRIAGRVAAVATVYSTRLSRWLNAAEEDIQRVRPLLKHMNLCVRIHAQVSRYTNLHLRTGRQLSLPPSPTNTNFPPAVTQKPTTSHPPESLEANNSHAVTHTPATQPVTNTNFPPSVTHEPTASPLSESPNPKNAHTVTHNISVISVANTKISPPVTHKLTLHLTQPENPTPRYPQHHPNTQNSLPPVTHDHGGICIEADPCTRAA